MATSNFMFCGSDEEILNAMRMADDIATEVNSAVSVRTSDEASGLIDESGPVSVFVSDFSEDSGCPMSQECSNTLSDQKNSFHMDSEHERLIQSISSLQLMCDLTIEENRKIETESNNFVKNSVEGSKQVLSVQMLNEDLEDIKFATSHVLVICKQISEIKQALGNVTSQKTLTVNPSCQKAVMKFYLLANELIINVEKNMFGIEACLKSGVDDWESTRNQVMLQISTTLEEFERRLDVLSEIRSSLNVLLLKEMKCINNTVSSVESSCCNPPLDFVDDSMNL